MSGVAGRSYVHKTYQLDRSRGTVVAFIEEAIEESGARLLHCSYRDLQVAPIFVAAEARDGSRLGLMIYPFTATRRPTKNRPPDENRAQIRFGDPGRERDAENPVAFDAAGVDVTMVLAVDPDQRIFVGLDPLVYADLPMGISVYFRDHNVSAVQRDGWAVWERSKKGGSRRVADVKVEALIGFGPERLLDYARFEAQASALGLSPGLRAALAETFSSRSHGIHHLEEFFGIDSRTLLDIVDSNFRLRVALRGGVAEHHLEHRLVEELGARQVRPLDQDGLPDFEVSSGGLRLLVECKTSSPRRYANGDFKVEAQKTRDSGSGRKYPFGQFDVLAVCLFPATGRWDYRFRWAADLVPWRSDPARIAPVQRVNDRWFDSMTDLIASRAGR